jgi:hypothetical protein
MKSDENSSPNFICRNCQSLNKVGVTSANVLGSSNHTDSPSKQNNCVKVINSWEKKPKEFGTPTKKDDTVTIDLTNSSPEKNPTPIANNPVISMNEATRNSHIQIINCSVGNTENAVLKIADRTTASSTIKTSEGQSIILSAKEKETVFVIETAAVGGITFIKDDYLVLKNDLQLYLKYIYK